MNSIFICFVVIFLQLIFFSRLKKRKKRKSEKEKVKKKKKIIIIFRTVFVGELNLLDPTIRSSSYSTSTFTPDLQAVKSRGLARAANGLDFKLASTTATGGVSTTGSITSTSGSGSFWSTTLCAFSQCS